MRTSKLLPKECMDEIRATLEEWVSSSPRTELDKEEKSTAIMMLEWVLNEEE